MFAWDDGNPVLIEYIRIVVPTKGNEVVVFYMSCLRLGMQYNNDLL